MAESSSSATDVFQQPDLVTDPSKDIAVNSEERRMCVNLPGRQKFQYIFCEDGEKTIKPYNAETDLIWSPSVQPTPVETQPDRGLAKMLIVGLTNAENLRQYLLPPAMSKSKKCTEERKSAAMVQRPDKCLRVLVRQTEFIDKTVHYYVAVQPVNGISRLRTIAGKAVFFLPEFVPGDWDKIRVKVKPSRLNLSCKTHAANIKGPRPSQTASVLIEDAKSENE